MAEPGRTVRVSGLPTDVEADRLRDKLFIHFLRARNGGGEITSVTIVKATPVSALVTFEDSGVAQRVVQHSRHVLEVDGRKYKVVVTEHCESLDPDKVILSLSATVDHSRLPGGITALTSLRRIHPDVQINHDAAEELCTLSGAYSKVQSALAQLLGHPPSAGHKDSDGPATSGSRSGQTAQKPQESQNQSRKPNKLREQREKVHIDGPDESTSRRDQTPGGDGVDLTPGGDGVDLTPGGDGVDLTLGGDGVDLTPGGDGVDLTPGGDGVDLTPGGDGVDLTPGGDGVDLTPGGDGWDDTGQTEPAALQLPDTPEEDFSLIVDADMFQYLQKHFQTDYQQILSQYGVDVVDMTNQGLTTLFLQVAPGAGEGGRDQERLKSARKAIGRLYQENETKIRRDQFPKSILSLRGGQQRVMQSLRVRFPKLLLNEDERNIYIIGSSVEVSEAKQFLLLEPSDVRGKTEDSLLRHPPHDPGPSGQEQRVSITVSPGGDSPDDRMEELLRSEEDERRAEGARRYKLAARFKDSGLVPLGSRPTDFTLRGLSSPGRPTRLGPMLGHDVRSETAGENVSRAQNTGEDILFKNGDASRTSSNSHLTDTRPKSFTSPLSRTQSSFSGSAPLPPAGSGSTLKRASSFSGTPRRKAQVTSQKSQDDSGTVRARVGSSGFSHQTVRDKREVCSAEVTVPTVMWKHIKEAYRLRVDDLTSDVQMKESSSDGSGDLTVTLRGANSSNVTSCQSALQNLVDSVSVDFCVHKLRLSELGVSAADETLQVCCTEVRSRFKKVTVQILNKHLFLIGPQALCSQIAASLQEVFSGKSSLIPEQQDFTGPSVSNWTPSTFLLMNEDQSRSLQVHSDPQVMREKQPSQERRPTQRRDLSETELVNGSVSPSVRREPVLKEKVRLVGTEDMDGQKTETFVSLTKTGNDSVRHVTPTDGDVTLQKTERTVNKPEIQDTPEESRSGLGSRRCVCGGSETMTTKCGATLCSKCLDSVHVHCRVCHETETRTRGVHGKMSCCKLHISVPGHTKDSAIKITYCIPDGIQGEDHPSPGEPFQGGQFEAFLPDSDKSRRLVPRLERAFKQGLTFTVTGNDSEAKVIWDCIPHKTTLHGGKSGNGYPDSTYLTRLSQVLTSKGIEESPARS